jgi:hypothetical protein
MEVKRFGRRLVHPVGKRQDCMYVHLPRQHEYLES